MLTLTWLMGLQFDKEQLKEQLLTPEQHCQYKYLAHAEGFAYSGRLKYLQQVSWSSPTNLPA